MLSGKRYGSLRVWERELGISSNSIKKRLGNFKGITGRGSQNHVCEHGFYPEPKVRKVCHDLLADIPQTNDEGFVKIKRKIYGSINSWRKKYDVNFRTVMVRMSNLESIKGKGPKGHICDLYSESDVLEVCADIFQDMPCANSSGIIKKGREKYGPINYWSKIFGVSHQAIGRHLQNINGIQGKDPGGRILIFYPESAVRSACSDLLPSPRKNGKK